MRAWLVRCPACGAFDDLEAGRDASRCPVCATEHALDPEASAGGAAAGIRAPDLAATQARGEPRTRAPDCAGCAALDEEFVAARALFPMVEDRHRDLPTGRDARLILLAAGLAAALFFALGWLRRPEGLAFLGAGALFLLVGLTYARSFALKGRAYARRKASYHALRRDLLDQASSKPSR